METAEKEREMPHFHQSHPKEPLDQRQRMLETPIDRLILSLAVPTELTLSKFI